MVAFVAQEGFGSCFPILQAIATATEVELVREMPAVARESRVLSVLNLLVKTAGYLIFTWVCPPS